MALLQNCRGLYCDFPIKAGYRLHRMSLFFATDASSNTASARFYGPRYRADYTMACICYFAFHSTFSAFVSLRKWIGAVFSGVKYHASRTCASFLVAGGARCSKLSFTLEECLSMQWTSGLLKSLPIWKKLKSS